MRTRRSWSALAAAALVLAVLPATTWPAEAAARAAACTITGTSGPDVLVGGAGNDVICGLGGGDRLVGRGGNDELRGGAGTDVLRGGGDDDTLTGGSGDDDVKGGGGDDTVKGGTGDDSLGGGAGNDLLRGRDANRFRDVLNCGPGGADSAYADPPDVVSPSCEDVTRNDPPTELTLAPSAVAEDEPVGTAVGQLSATDPDPGDTHEFDLVPGAGATDNASFTIVGDSLRTAAVFDFETDDELSIRVRATDEAGATYEQSLTVSVTDENETPVAVDDTYSTPEDTPLTRPVTGPGSPAANDTDADGDPLTVTAVSGATGGTAAISAGTITFTPTANLCGPAAGHVDYTVSDGRGGTDVGRVTIDITCVPDNPVARDDDAAVAEDAPATAIPVLANDDDPDGDPLNIASVTQPSHGTVVRTGAGTGLTYQPGAGYCNDPPGTAPDTFTYTLTPGGSTATVSVTVTCHDDIPSAVNDAATVLEDAPATAINVLANDTDADGGPMSVASVTQPTHGAVVVTGGGSGLTYKPALDYCNDPPGGAPDTFTYTLNGGSTATVSVTVTCVPDDPTAVNDAGTVAEDASASAIGVLGNDTDPDGGPMVIVSASDPDHGTVALTGGTPGAHTGLTYEPDADYCNSGAAPDDTFTYTLNGGSTATVSVTVTCVDDDPDAVNDSDAVLEDAAATAIDVLGNDTDIDAGPMTISSASDPANGTVELTGGALGAHTGLTYEPDPDYCNSGPAPDDTFTYTLNGGSSATVSITVTCVDDAPVAVDDSDTVLLNAAATAIGVLANDTDIDAGPMTITSASDPDHGTVVLTGGSPGAHTGLTYEPDTGYCNDPPGTDPDTFTYTLNGGSTATVSVTVTCDVPPTAVNDTATVGEDDPATSVDVRANDTDPDGGPKTVDTVTPAAHGTVVIAGDSLSVTYKPDLNYCNTQAGGSPDTFTYTLNGGSTATVSVTVSCVDDDPVAVDDADTLLEDASATAVDVLANDSDVEGDAITITSAGDPANGTVAVTGGGTGLTYQPDPDYCNDPPGTTPDTFTYTVNGGDTATVSMTVTCVPDAPTLTNSAGPTTYTENDAATAVDAGVSIGNPDGLIITGGSVGITANFESGEDVLAWTDNDAGDSIVEGTSTASTLVLTGDGSTAEYVAALRAVTYRNTSDDPSTLTRTATFTVTTSAGSPSDTIDITVNAVNDAPVAVADADTVLEDASATAVDVLANDTDVEGDAITISSAGDPAHGTVVVTGPVGAGTGLTYQPDADYCNSQVGGSPDTFDYTVNGGDTATVSMTVTCQPDAPTLTNSAGPTTYTENAAATAVDAGVSISNPDGLTITDGSVEITTNFQSGQDVLDWADNNPGDTITEGASTASKVVLTGNGTAAEYAAALAAVTYANSSDSPSTAARTATFTVTTSAGSPSDTIDIAVTAVDDDPVAVNDAATVLEDAGATAVPVLANDTDADSGPMSITSVTQPTNGAVVITGGGTGLTYAPNPNYCNDGSPLDTFTYALTPGGDDATVSMTVTCVNDLPVADDESFSGAQSAIGNTVLVGNDPSDGPPTVAGPNKAITGDILDGDADVDGPGPLVVTAGTIPSNDGGTVVLESDGDFTFTPAAGTSCSDTSDFFDYTVSDQNPGTPATDVGRVTIAISGCVWYVHNNAAGDAGTSTAPFDTLAQAETASGDTHTVFVFDGDDTSAGYDDATGYQMNSGERLVGEASDLAVGGDLLYTGVPGNRPTITANGADVVSLDDGNEVRGVSIDPQGAGGGIAGGSGDAGGTIDDVNIVDDGTAGTQPGIELASTTGTFTVSNLTVSTNGATGIRLNNAGTVALTSAGTISVSVTGGGTGLDFATTATSGTIDSTTVTSGATGIVIDDDTGSLVLNDINLTTTGTGLWIDSSNDVTVSGGDADINAGGTAVSLTTVTSNPANPPDVTLDQVTSTGGPTGINIDDIGVGTLSAQGGALSGHSSAEVDINNGSGDITYPGNLNNGSGASAEITGRSGGAVSLGGQVNDTSDAGGGIVVGGAGALGNTGGSTTFGNSVKSLDTGAGNAVSMTNSDGHTLTLSGGGLNVDTTSGSGVAATTSGTLNVTGTGNTIDTGSGKALNVSDTDVGGTPLTFEHISSNGANGGIALSNTGSNNALTVSSSGSGTCTSASTAGCSGGTIQGSTGADNAGTSSVGTGIYLNNTKGVSLTRMHLHDHSNYGVWGENLVGLTVVDSVIGGTNGTSALTANKDGSARFEELTGTVTMTNVAISGGYFTNLMVDNTAGVLNATLDNVDSGTIDATGGDDAVQFEGIGTSDMNVNYTNSTITTASGDLFQYIGDGTGGGDLDFTNNVLTNNEPSINTGGGGVALVAGAKGAATMDVLNNTMRDSLTNALTVIKSRDVAGGTNNLVANIGNNSIGLAATPNSGSAEGDGMEITTFGDGNATFNVTNNDVRQYNSSAFQFVAGSGVADTGQFNVNFSGNSAANPGTNPSITLLQGVRVDSGVDAGDTFATCVDFGPNTITGSSDAANKDFRLVASQSTTIRQPGYVGGNTDGTAFAAFAAAQIGGGAVGTAVANAPGTFSGTGTTCP